MCIARKLYAYANGLNSEDVEPSAVKTAYKAFSDAGFRLRALIKGMVEATRLFQRGSARPRDPLCCDEGRRQVTRRQP